MSVTWSGEGPALLLALDRTDGTPLGHQLQDQLRVAVRDGRLRAGERLPSARRLSEELRVSRGMVVACYSNSSPRATWSGRPARARDWRPG